MDYNKEDATSEIENQLNDTRLCVCEFGHKYVFNQRVDFGKSDK